MGVSHGCLQQSPFHDLCGSEFVLMDSTPSTGSTHSATVKEATPDQNFVHLLEGSCHVKHYDGDIFDHYNLEQDPLGVGGNGSVRKAVDKTTGKVYAVKTMCRRKNKCEEEIRIMKMMDHPNMIKLYATYKDWRNYYLVMELCTGGELFDKVLAVTAFTERQAAVVMEQVFRATLYAHEKGVVHRDLKPENFLFLTNDPIEKATLKIIDFGLSCVLEPGEKMKARAGTPYYMAPEVVNSSYDCSCDLWSLGVVMYVLLCGYPPFNGSTVDAILAKVTDADLKFHDKYWSHISIAAKNLLHRLITRDVSTRLSAAEALEDTWVKDHAPGADSNGIGDSLAEQLQGFRSTARLKKAALHVIAWNIDHKHVKELEETFSSMDLNKDGHLTAPEIQEAVKQAGMPDIAKDLENIIHEMDTNGSGKIDYHEFLAATIEKHKHIQEDACWCAFRVFDHNGDGHICSKEIDTLMSSKEFSRIQAKDSAKNILAEVDRNQDGLISFEEFLHMMNGE